MSDAADDLEALFDEISSQHTQPAAAASAPAAAQPDASGDSDDLEALFDQVASEQQPAAAAAAAPAAEPSEAELENLFDQISSSQVAPAAQASESGAAKTENHSDKPMFDRLGAIVRQLHDSLRELGYDRSLADVAEQMVDSKSRLEYVASLTEQAANKVLNAIDEGLPAQEELSTNAKGIEERWGRLFDGKLSLDEFKALAGDSRQFAAQVAKISDVEKARLMDIMMAQDFQDITGQIIKKIVGISTKLEQELAQLLRDNAPAGLQREKESKPAELMEGPSLPAQAMAQDDVDSLLADLGF